MAGITTARGSRLAAIYAMEDSWASLPSSVVAYNLRITGFGVQLSKDSFQSEELRSDRQIADLRHGMFSVEGDIPVELSAGAFDDLISSAMFDDWSENDEIVIGTEMKSFTLQRGFTDIGQYHWFPGCVVNSWSLNIEPNAIVTSTFNVIGETMETGETAELTGASDKATNAPFDSFSGFIREGGTGTGDEIAVVTGLDLSVENNIEALQVVGMNKSAGLADGRANITGTLNAYFVDSVMLNKFLNETESSLSFQLEDDAGNSLEFYLPRIKYSGSDLSVDSEAPVTLSMPFTALVDTDGIGTTMKITRSLV